MTAMPPALWTYRARVTRLIDGDTLDVTLDMGLHNYRTERLRLLGVDTPECETTTRAAGDAATEYVRAWLSAADIGDWPLIIRTHKADSFGRYLARVWRAADGVCLNDDIIAAGHGVVFMPEEAGA